MEYNTGSNDENWLNNDSFLSDLKKEYGVISESLNDTELSAKGIYLQDTYMKDVFNFYPDRLCLDLAHKHCNNLDISMYIFLCEDSNGRNEIISVGFLKNEDSESFLWLMNTFKKHNPNWRKIKLIAIDPEIKFKEIIRNIIPTPYMIICFHHAFKCFRKGLELVKVQNALPLEQVQYAIELFKSMYNAHSTAEYELYYQQFLMLHSSIVLLFQEKWLILLHLWRTGLDFFHENIFSSLNCHLENLDLTLKSVFSMESSLQNFINKLFVILSLKRGEKINETFISDPSLYSRFSVEYSISKVLTPYASKFVIDQYGLSLEIHMDCSILSDNYYFDNLGSPVNASISMCQCQFFLYTFLPCRHIFAVRKTLNILIFDESLIEYSWTNKFYQSSLTSLEETVDILNSLALQQHNSKQEFAAHLLEKSLPSLFSSMQMSESRISLLHELINLWKNDKNVYLQFEGIELETVSERSCDLSLPDPSQLCKVETDISFEPSTSQNSRTECLNKKFSLPSKSFKMEYSDPTPPPTNKISPLEYFRSGTPVIRDISFGPNKWNFKTKILDGKHINYAYLCRIICDSKETCIDWLRQMELICTNMLCPTCGFGMTMKLVPRLSDGAVWICSNEMEVKKSCSRRCSVRRGSWFELTNMSFEQILTFCYMWVNGYTQNQILSETGISTQTFISWNKLSKRVCEERLMDDSKFSLLFKGESISYAKTLEAWLQTCAEDDSFLKFLQDANAMHRKDSVKHSMG